MTIFQDPEFKRNVESKRQLREEARRARIEALKKNAANEALSAQIEREWFKYEEQRAARTMGIARDVAGLALKKNVRFSACYQPTVYVKHWWQIDGNLRPSGPELHGWTLHDTEYFSEYNLGDRYVTKGWYPGMMLGEDGYLHAFSGRSQGLGNVSVDKVHVNYTTPAELAKWSMNFSLPLDRGSARNLDCAEKALLNFVLDHGLDQ